MTRKDISICKQVAVECVIVTLNSLEVKTNAKDIVVTAEKHFIPFLTYNLDATTDEIIRRQAALKRACLSTPIIVKGEDEKILPLIINYANEYLKYF